MGHEEEDMRENLTSVEISIASVQGRRGYAGQTAIELQQQRLSRLMEAGMHLFGTQGYAATNTQQLCRHAKVTTRHFYEVFKDKETLLCQLFDQLMQDTFMQVSQTLLASNAALLDRLNEGLNAFIRAQLDDPRRARITAIEILGVSQQAERHRQQAIDRFVDLIEMYFGLLVQQHGWPARHYRVWAVAMVGAMHELQIAHLNQPAVFDPVTIADELNHIIGTLLQQHTAS